MYFEPAGGDPFSVAAINLLLFAFLVFAAVAVVGAFRRLPLAYGAYALAALALPLSYPVDPQPLMSLPRFIAVLFPLFIWLAVVTEERGWTRYMPPCRARARAFHRSVRDVGVDLVRLGEGGPPDVLGTLVELESPAPALREEIERRTGMDVGEERADAAFAAEIGYYLAHHLEGRDMEAVEGLRDRCAEEIRRTLASRRTRPRDGPRGDARRAPLPRVPGCAAAAAGAPRARRARRCREQLGRLAPEALERTGLAPYLDGAVSSAVVGAAKPDPAVFTAALERRRCEPGEAFHVGDSPDGDVEGALAVGVAWR